MCDSNSSGSVMYNNNTSSVYVRPQYYIINITNVCANRICGKKNERKKLLLIFYKNNIM